jgi:hypothetical protein
MEETMFHKTLTDGEKSNSGSSRNAQRFRTAAVVAILLTIALPHLFRIGSYLPVPLFKIYYSYFSDVIVPFGMCFLLCLIDRHVRFLKDWRIKAGAVFLIASSTEGMQALGIPLLGQNFDPIDFGMFAAGVLLAALVDRGVLGRYFARWSSKTGS